MSRPNALQSIWPSCSDDDFGALPQVRKARRMFGAQMSCLGELAGQSSRSPTGADTHHLSQEIAILLHNIAGTAAYFGEAEFGTFASELEQPVRAALTADALRPLCTRILAHLAPDEID